MTFCNPEISGVFDTAIPFVNSLVIENQRLFFELITDISEQIDGCERRSVMSDGDKILAFSKRAELLTTFVPFEMNRKTLVSKIISAAEKTAVNSENYMKTMQLMTNIENYIADILSEFDCSLNYPKISPASIIKAAGIEIDEGDGGLCEKVVDYMSLVREFDCEKLFITVNMRSYVTDDDAELFMKTVLDHEFNILMIENRDYRRLTYEKRLTVDADLCEF